MEFCSFGHDVMLASYVSRSGRSDVKRAVVTVAVPVFVTSTSMTATSKEIIASALQAAIQSGDFLSYIRTE
jgi:uncharacterized protein YqhQ